MSDSKEHLRDLLDKAISTPAAEIVNFQALRELLEASIDYPASTSAPKHLDTESKGHIPVSSIDQTKKSIIKSSGSEKSLAQQSSVYVKEKLIKSEEIDEELSSLVNIEHGKASVTIELPKNICSSTESSKIRISKEGIISLIDSEDQHIESDASKSETEKSSESAKKIKRPTEIKHHGKEIVAFVEQRSDLKEIKLKPSSEEATKQRRDSTISTKKSVFSMSLKVPKEEKHISGSELGNLKKTESSSQLSTSESKIRGPVQDVRKSQRMSEIKPPIQPHVESSKHESEVESTNKYEEQLEKPIQEVRKSQRMSEVKTHIQTHPELSKIESQIESIHKHVEQREKQIQDVRKSQRMSGVEKPKTLTEETTKQKESGSTIHAKKSILITSPKEPKKEEHKSGSDKGVLKETNTTQLATSKSEIKRPVQDVRKSHKLSEIKTPAQAHPESSKNESEVERIDKHTEKTEKPIQEVRKSQRMSGIETVKSPTKEATKQKESGSTIHAKKSIFSTPLKEQKNENYKSGIELSASKESEASPQLSTSKSGIHKPVQDVRKSQRQSEIKTQVETHLESSKDESEIETSDKDVVKRAQADRKDDGHLVEISHSKQLEKVEETGLTESAEIKNPSPDLPLFELTPQSSMEVTKSKRQISAAELTPEKSSSKPESGIKSHSTIKEEKELHSEDGKSSSSPQHSEKSPRKVQKIKSSARSMVDSKDHLAESEVKANTVPEDHLKPTHTANIGKQTDSSDSSPSERKTKTGSQHKVIESRIHHKKSEQHHVATTKGSKIMAERKQSSVAKASSSMPWTKRLDMIYPEKSKKLDKMNRQLHTKEIMGNKLQKYKKSIALLLDIEKSDTPNVRRVCPLGMKSLYSSCECNAMRNSNHCICDPKVCLAKKWTQRHILCFCANSYGKGSDGITYHTTCNCCESLHQSK